MTTSAMIVDLDDTLLDDRTAIRYALTAFLEAHRLGVEPSRCLMIGDDSIRDLEPARALGMRTFLVQKDDPARNLLQAVEVLYHP